MSKITLNSALFITTILISLILLISTIKDVFSFFFSLLIWLLVYFFTSFLMKSGRFSKTISERSLKYLSYFIFIFTAIFFTSFLIRNYFPHSINFLADYNGDLYGFLEQYRFSQPSNPYFRPLIETVELFFAIDVLLIGSGLSVLIAVCLKVFALENKKER